LLAFAILIALLGTAFLGVLLTEVGHRNSNEARLLIGLSVAAVLLSWLMLHVAFGKQYARFYYSGKDREGKPLPRGSTRGGFQFLDTEQPCYLDFMYVAIAIGLTYAIEDVNTTSGHIRQIVLVHSLISFFFYSIVLGGTLNAIVTS
jgi:uncharacterized membrane protein